MKEETLKGKFRYDPQVSDYTVKVKKPYPWWWWLLLLLLFVPLFIRCERTVTVKVVDRNGQAVENTDIDLSYTAHFFLAHTEEINEKGTTDAKGRVTFHDLPCSVYSYLFHSGETMTVSYDPPAIYAPGEKEVRFHKTDQVLIVLEGGKDEEPEPEPVPDPGQDYTVQVVDAMDGSPLAAAEVVVTRAGSGLGSFSTDANGMAVIPGLQPNDRLALAGRKPGYLTNDTTLADVRARDLGVTPPRQIPLTKDYSCDDNMQRSGGNEPETVIAGVDMHKTGGTFTVDFLTYSYPDRLQVFDEDGSKIFDTGVVLHDPMPGIYSGIRFKGRRLTFKVLADPANPTSSVWVVTPHCPD